MYSCEGIFYQDFIAQICRVRQSRTYLEIGVQQGINLSKVEVDYAIGVDPNFLLSVDPTVGKRVLSLHRVGSDAYFSSTDVKAVDLAFLDGMHLFEYLLRDFYNVEAVSAPSGLVMMHDCLPFNEQMISRPEVAGAWTGDVWKIVLILEKFRPDLKVTLVDCAPTGLVCVSNLAPSSSILKDRYFDIVQEFYALPNDIAALEQFYKGREVISALEILSDFNHTRFFRV